MNEIGVFFQYLSNHGMWLFNDSLSLDGFTSDNNNHFFVVLKNSIYLPPSQRISSTARFYTV